MNGTSLRAGVSRQPGPPCRARIICTGSPGTRSLMANPSKSGPAFLAGFQDLADCCTGSVYADYIQLNVMN